MKRVWLGGLIPLAIVAALPARGQDAPAPKPAPSAAEVELAVRTNDEAGVVLPAFEKLDPKNGGVPDHAGAMKILVDAANKNNRLAAKMLVWVYTGIFSDPPDAAQRLKWNLVLAGDTAPKAIFRIDAAHDVGVAYRYGQGTEVDFVQAARWLKVAAEGGSVDAMVMYAIQLFRGEGVEKDLPAAIRWLTLASDKGHAVAMTVLASSYQTGEGVTKDPVKALALYEQAAAKGNNIAQLEAGKLYLQERADPAKLAKGVAYVRQAADGGNVEAMGVLGILYWNGIGVDKDVAQSVDWMRKSAKGGYTRSMLAFLAISRDTKCAAVSCEEAQDWIIKAGEAGNPEGLYLTGDMYEKGVGKLSKDPAKAIECYRKAAALGYDKAKAALARLGISS